MSSLEALDACESELIMTAGQVAFALTYVQRKDGQPDRKKVYRLVRAGIIPPPLNDQLDTRDWRWSRFVIERYARGEWKPAS